MSFNLQLLLPLGVLLLSYIVQALYEEEAGRFDYTMNSAGHGYGGVTFARPNRDGTAIITSTSVDGPFISSEHSDSSIGKFGGLNNNMDMGCHVSLRNVTNGALLWRRDVCSHSPSSSVKRVELSSKIRHTVYVPGHRSIHSSNFYTLDNVGLFRKWDQTSGAILMERCLPVSDVAGGEVPRILGLGDTVVPVYTSSAYGGDVLSFRDNNVLLARDVLEGCNITASTNAVAHFFGMIPASHTPYFGKEGGTVVVLAGWVESKGQQYSGRVSTSSPIFTSIGKMATLEVEYKLQSNGNHINKENNDNKNEEKNIPKYSWNHETQIMNHYWKTSKSHKLHYSPTSYIASQTLLASSVRYVRTNVQGIGKDKVSYLIAITSNREGIQSYSPEMRTGKHIEMASLQHPHWSFLQSLEPIFVSEEYVESKSYGSHSLLKIVGGYNQYYTTHYTTAVILMHNMTRLYHSVNGKYEDEGTDYNGLTVCHNVVLTFTSKRSDSLSSPVQTSISAFYHKEDDGNVMRAMGIEILGDATSSIGGQVNNVHLMKCVDDGMETVVTTVGGETHHISVEFVPSFDDSLTRTIFIETQLYVRENWKAEEALGSVTSAIFLDETHSPRETYLSVKEVIKDLSFKSRLFAQIEKLKIFVISGFMENMQSIVGGISSSSSTILKNDYNFGYTKVAVMLSSPLAKVMGIDTLSGGKMIWSLNINIMADWHKIVHGGSTSRSLAFGQDPHHPHSHEILVLSHITKDNASEDNGDVALTVVEWYCVDGLRGHVYSKSHFPVSSPVVQVAPIYSYGGDGGCRQNAILLHDDDTLTIVPNTMYTSGGATETMSMNDRMYIHKVDVDRGAFSSFKVIPTPGDRSGSVRVVGESSFDPAMEKILSVTYPQRNEVIQSPATILGDDSLLLKYMNPHLCVVVTEATSGLLNQLGCENGEGCMNATISLYKSLSSKELGVRREKKLKSKPIGATELGDYPTLYANVSTSATSKVMAIPSLFINLIDTVSGQILHRVSHVHTTPGKNIKTSHVPVIISENWIIYAFKNNRHRRTELGVLTLHEGMIDRKGITAFVTPDQEMTFSSLTNPKPIVLAKTYGLPKHVSAIGVTNTMSGISSKNLLFGTGASGQIVVMDRRWLDPRRPTGEPKQSETKEGIMKYSPLLPMAPLMTSTYTNDVSFVTSIVSVAVNLESQSLVLGFGGPDIFFTRLAPSREFDSLPEDFNRLLLLILVFGLFVLMTEAKRRSKKKMVEICWS